jgi:two-component system NtrC family sensor kinase
MKRFFLIIFFVSGILSTKAQIPATDSIISLLKNTREDTTRVMLIAELSRLMQWSNPDSAYALALEGINLARNINFTRGELNCKTSAAACSWSLANYALAIELLLPVLPIAEKTKDDRLLGFVYGNLHNAYRDQGDYTEAIKYAFKNLQLTHQIENCKFCRVVRAAIAFDFLMLGNKDSMRYFLMDALQYPPSFGTAGWSYSVAGVIYADQKKYDSAFIFYRLGIPMLILENNQKDLAWTYNNITSLFKLTGQLDSAFFYVYKSLSLSREKRFPREAMESNLLLAELYELKRSDSAFYYFKKAITARDSLYSHEKQRQILGYKFKEDLYKQEAEAEKKEKENRIRQYFLAGLVIFFLAIVSLLLRNIRQKQKAKKKIEKAYDDLKTTQKQLIQSEKMASLGELTAGIAHEIQNPLNFVNNFSDVNTELIDELKSELASGNMQLANQLADDIKDNEQKINHHGKRADAIVKGMLQHSRTSSGQKEPTDINALCDEYLRLAFHGLRAKDKSFKAKFESSLDPSIGKINVAPQEIGRVILNLINNAFYAVNEKKKIVANGFEPTVFITTKRTNNKVEVRVRDNGTGIPQKVIDKIFQPFFTTKPTGQGTGLGLSLSYDIIKTHGGDLKVETKEGEGSEFIIILPA